MTDPADKSAEDKVRAARARAAFLRPYFSRVLYALIPRQTAECPTMAVDKWGRLYYAPAFVHRYEVPELAAVLLHEVGHILRRHHERAHALGVTDATHLIANIAQDCELNDDLREEIKARRDLPNLPGKPWYPEDIGCKENEVWEVYYAHLMDNIDQQQAMLQQAGGDGDGGDEDGPSKQQGGTSSDDQSGRGQGSKGRQQQQGSKSSGGSSGQRGRQQGGGGQQSGGAGHSGGRWGDCGSVAHGVPCPWEEADPSRTGAEGVHDADWRDIERRTAEDIRQAQENPKLRGSIPGTWVEWADDILRPITIPWDVELAGALRWALNDVAGMVLHSYRRPSRRQQALPDVVLPTMRRPVPTVSIVGDTSGSMSADDLALVRGTVSDICSALGATVHFIATDAQVHAVQQVADGRGIEMRGRGGTNMKIGIECALNDVRPPPDVVVVLTDCETDWPAEDPGTRIVIGAINVRNESAIAACPEWARVIRIDVQEEP